MIITSFSGIFADTVVPIDDTVFYGQTISSAAGGIDGVSDENGISISGDESSFAEYEKRWKVQDMIESFLSPTKNYEQIAGAILGNDFNMLSNSPQSEIGIFEVLSSKVSNIITMLVWAIVSLIATYLVFMRQDIR